MLMLEGKTCLLRRAFTKWLAFVPGAWWIPEPSSKRLRMSHTRWGSRKRKSCPGLNRQRFWGASRRLPTQHGWRLFSPRMGREPSPVLFLTLQAEESSIDLL